MAKRAGKCLEGGRAAKRISHKKPMLGIVLAAYVLVPTTHAYADGKMRELLSEGDWVAFSHQASMTASPDVCIAANKRTDFGFKSSKDLIEIRVGSGNWLLSDQDSGVELIIGEYTGRFKIEHHKLNMAAASLTDSQVQLLFRAMDDATSMTFRVGTYKRTLSLVGSTKVINSFMRCAGLFAPRTKSPDFDFH